MRTNENGVDESDRPLWQIASYNKNSSFRMIEIDEL